MEHNVGSFQLKYKGAPLLVEKLELGGQKVFKVLFPENPVPLLLTRARKSPGTFFWTSLPEGRQKEAEEIGILIEAYYNSFA